MELLSWGFFNILLTAIITCGILAAIASACVWALRPARVDLGLTFLAVFTFSVLGFVTGKILGNSREAAVGTVIPAILTLLGGITVYVIGVKGPRVQGPVSAMVLCFALSLFFGSHFGAQLRYSYETFINNPALIGHYALVAEQHRQAVELQRLGNYVEFLTFKQAFETERKLDLSGFQSSLEKPAEKKESSAKKK